MRKKRGWDGTGLMGQDGVGWESLCGDTNRLTDLTNNCVAIKTESQVWGGMGRDGMGAYRWDGIGRDGMGI